MRIMAIGLVLLLGACAHPDGLRVGMTRDELDARFGKPDAVRHETAGDVQIYSSAPLGERASAVHLDATGRVVTVEPLLDIKHDAHQGDRIEQRVGTDERRRLAHRLHNRNSQLSHDRPVGVSHKLDNLFARHGSNLLASRL